MANSDSFFARWEPRALSVLRVVTAFLFMAHGAQKLFAVLTFPTKPGDPAPAPAAMFTLNWTAGVLELFGGLLIFLGLFTRPVAFILSGLMAVAYFMGHAPAGFWPLLNKGEMAVLYCFVFLFLSVAGGGEWSLDRLLRRDAARQ